MPVRNLHAAAGITLAALSPASAFALDCQAGERPVEISIGISPTQDLEPGNGFPGGAGSVEWLDFLYPAPVADATTRGIEYVGLNPDGTFRDSDDPAYSERDREFIGVSITGRYDVRMCLPESARGGLVHAIYSNSSGVTGFLTAPTPIVVRPSVDTHGL